jgi:hypothetical protein
MSVIMMVCSLSAMSFVINLRIELRREIGLKSFGVTGFEFFGIKVMKELFIGWRLMFTEKKSLHNW